uniref:Uncharacterized protein n=1 Tax=Anguilla anguilla TaxID=7936 RepID=A0A0E9UC14_ANGAN
MMKIRTHSDEGTRLPAPSRPPMAFTYRLESIQHCVRPGILSVFLWLRGNLSAVHAG